MPGRSCAVAAVVAGLLISGCVSKSSPLAPSAPDTSQSGTAAVTPLTVRVVTRGAEVPIPDATVFKNDVLVGRTNADGIVDATVTAGVEFHITVAAAGYAGNGAWGTVENQERWTFYLEPQP